MLIAVPLSAQDMSVFEKRVYTEDAQSLSYRIMFPKNYDSNKKYPLVLFLHGAGERGSDNEKQLKNGGQWLIDNLQTDYPAIVIAPQCPENDYWAHIKREVLPKGSPMMLKFTFYKDSVANPSLKLLMGLTKEWINSGKINKKQVYVGGHFCSFLYYVWCSESGLVYGTQQKDSIVVVSRSGRSGCFCGLYPRRIQTVE